MNGKIVSLLLVGLVALSIIYSCSGSLLPSHPTQSTEAVRSLPSTPFQKPNENTKLSIQKIGQHVTGEPIDDPTPNYN